MVHITFTKIDDPNAVAHKVDDTHVCKTCKWYRGSRYGDLCTHEAVREWRPVNGYRFTSAGVERTHGTECAVEGKLWEPIPPKPPRHWMTPPGHSAIYWIVAAAILVFFFLRQHGG